MQQAGRHCGSNRGSCLPRSSSSSSGVGIRGLRLAATLLLQQLQAKARLAIITTTGGEARKKTEGMGEGGCSFSVKKKKKAPTKKICLWEELAAAVAEASRAAAPENEEAATWR